MPKQIKALLFIDTNVLLDFYRVRGRQGGLSILSHIDDNHERVITTSQVEMEFKKNRARAILEGLSDLKQVSSLDLPSYLAESKQAAGLTTNRKKMNQQVETLRSRLTSVLQTPTRFDPVYKVAQRLFKARVPTNLRFGSDDFDPIHDLATVRWARGYPPRKNGDTSMGDAINWEWIVESAKRTGCDIVIVSRDRDYGEFLGKQGVINDWLRQEFQDRVGRRRKLLLTDRLAEGMKLASITVSKAEQKSEEDFLRTREQLVRQIALWEPMPMKVLPEEALARWREGSVVPPALQEKLQEKMRLIGQQLTSSIINAELLEALRRIEIQAPIEEEEGKGEADV